MKMNETSSTITVVERLKELIDDNVIYDSFLKNLKVKILKNGEIYLVFETKNDLKYIEKNYNDEIDKAMKHTFGVMVQYKTISNDEFLSDLSKNEAHNIINNNLNERYKFSNYIEGKFNRKIVSLGKKIIEDTKTIYNPIFIHSTSGMGKTHFLHALGNELVKKDVKVCYINPDHFIKKVTSYFMNQKQDKLSEIIDYYKEFDVLLFDDIQQYGSKAATLNILFNILNYNIENGNQIIIAADKNPDLLGGFEERFITRFQGGITEEIQQPSLDDLVKIFKEKLVENNLNPKDWETEAIKFIVRNHSSSIRTLEGAVNKIEWNHQQNIQNIKYTYQIVSQMFSSIFKKENENISPDHIVDIVGKYYNINKSDILGKSRRKDIVMARHISMWMIRNVINMTYKEIGNFFKGKDHSTVMTAIEKIDYQMKINETVKNTLKIIKSKISQN